MDIHVFWKPALFFSFPSHVLATPLPHSFLNLFCPCSDVSPPSCVFSFSPTSRWQLNARAAWLVSLIPSEPITAHAVSYIFTNLPVPGIQLPTYAALQTRRAKPCITQGQKPQISQAPHNCCEVYGNDLYGNAAGRPMSKATGVQTFYDPGSHPLLQARSWGARGKIAASGII
jgi:hypothetical protein